MSSGGSNPNPSRASRFQVKYELMSSGNSESQAQRDANQRIDTSSAGSLESLAAGDGPSTLKSGSASSMTPNSARTGRFVRRSLTPKRRDEIPSKRLRHSASAQARRHATQPSAGEPLFSPADDGSASGSGAGSNTTPSGPKGAPRDTPATEMTPDIVALIKLSVDAATKQAFEAGRQFTKNASATPEGKQETGSTVGDGAERSIHATIAILATGGFIDACLPRVNGEVPSEKITSSNCHALAAMMQFVQWPNQDIDPTTKLRNYVTPKRSDQLKEVKKAVCEALESCVKQVEVAEINAAVPPTTRLDLYDLMTKHVLDLETDDMVFCRFMSTFFLYIWDRGHTKTGHFEEGCAPHVAAVYQAEMVDFRRQIFVPVLLAAMSLLRAERRSDDDDGEEDCWKAVNREIAQVFGVESRKCAQKTTACERGFASQVWEISYNFMFGAGRAANFLLRKRPVDINKEDALRAFMPYLFVADDGEEQAASGGEQDDDDGAS